MKMQIKLKTIGYDLIIVDKTEDIINNQRLFHTYTFLYLLNSFLYLLWKDIHLRSMIPILYDKQK